MSIGEGGEWSGPGMREAGGPVPALIPAAGVGLELCSDAAKPEECCWPSVERIRTT
jgi:hypothetical protein